MRILFVEKIYPPNVIQFAFARVCVCTATVWRKLLRPVRVLVARVTSCVGCRPVYPGSVWCTVRHVKDFPADPSHPRSMLVAVKVKETQDAPVCTPLHMGGGAKNARNGNHPPSTKSYHRSFAFFVAYIACHPDAFDASHPSLPADTHGDIDGLAAVGTLPLSVAFTVRTTNDARDGNGRRNDKLFRFASHF